MFNSVTTVSLLGASPRRYATTSKSIERKCIALDPDLYLVGHRWQKLESRKELIAVRGAEPLEKIVRASRHGPTISDFRATSDGKEILTARWTAHEPSRELNSLYSLNCARNWKTVSGQPAPARGTELELRLCRREGNIGYALAGKIPRRASVPSLLPLDGWDERNDWPGYIPFDELPRIYNPPEGVIANANNGIADAAYPYYLSHFFDPPYRIRRIEQLLGQREKYSLGDLAALQLDHVSLHGRDLIGALETDLARIADDNRTVKAAANRLLAWDGDCAASSIEATIFHLMHQRLAVGIF